MILLGQNSFRAVLRIIPRSLAILLLLLLSLSFIMTPLAAKGAVLYGGSAYQTVEAGQTFVVDWFLDTENEELNTISLNLDFTAETLEVLQASPGASLVSLWLQRPEFSNQQGTLQLTGGFAGGVAGDRIPVFRTTFLAKQPGTAGIAMGQSSAALLADGLGTPASLTFQVLEFVIVPAGSLPGVISSPTHPESDKWYSERRVVVRIQTPSTQEQYSYSMSSNLDIFPDNIPDDVTEELVFDNLPDGIYYFKLNSQAGGSPWQEAGIFRVQIDTTPPEKFEPTVATDGNVFQGEPFLVFSTVDKTSGISHYKVKSGKLGIARQVASPTLLPRPLVGDRVEIQAVDAAGNVRQAHVDYPVVVSPPVLLGIITVLVALGIILIKKQILIKPKGTKLEA